MADHHLVAFGLEQPRISRGVVPQWCSIKFRCRGITIRERIYQSKNIPCADMPEYLVFTLGRRRTTLSQCHGNRRNESHTSAADPSTTTRSFVSAEPEGPNPSARMAEIANDRWLGAHLVDDSRHCATLGWSTRPTTTHGMWQKLHQKFCQFHELSEIRGSARKLAPWRYYPRPPHRISMVFETFGMRFRWILPEISTSNVSTIG